MPQKIVAVLVLSLLISFHLFSQKQPKITFVNVLIERDFEFKGSRGLCITGLYSFQLYKQIYTSDSLMLKAFSGRTFPLTLTLLDRDSIPVKSALGYSTLFAGEKISTNLTLRPKQSETTIGLTRFFWFVPYAALKLNT